MFAKRDAVLECRSHAAAVTGCAHRLARGDRGGSVCRGTCGTCTQGASCRLATRPNRVHTGRESLKKQLCAVECLVDGTGGSVGCSGTNVCKVDTIATTSNACGTSHDSHLECVPVCPNACSVPSCIRMCYLAYTL